MNSAGCWARTFAVATWNTSTNGGLGLIATE
jgi:hypothetical protein